MNELRRHGRELLDQARRERTPDAAARERVLGALLASAALATTSSPTASAAESKPLGGINKWLLLAAVASAVAGTVYAAGHLGVKPKAAPRGYASARRGGNRSP